MKKVNVSVQSIFNNKVLFVLVLLFLSFSSVLFAQQSEAGDSNCDKPSAEEGSNKPSTEKSEPTNSSSRDMFSFGDHSACDRMEHYGNEAGQRL